MLYMHFRDEGTPEWCDYKAIGYWDDIKIEGDQLSAIPVFDKVDDLSKTIAAKYEAGTLRAASIGIRILATSAEKEYLLPGQTRETVTKAEIMEASIVDIPANANAVRLYDRSTSVKLAAGMDSQVVPELKPFNPETMNFKPSWSAFLSFLGVAQDKSLNLLSLSAENLDAIHTELERLKAENNTLKQANQDAETKLETATSEVTGLKTDNDTKDTEISTLKTENGQLKLQVQNLKNAPTPRSKSSCAQNRTCVRIRKGRTRCLL
ncbi:HK97 family phage prohead protease [Bacteroides salyersiae]|nr:HK97 family phage prohead protease [Bacteroides salyersiae]